MKAYALQGRLRKRLAMALTWFQILDNKAESHVSEVVSGARIFPSLQHDANAS